jgi:hypothetical protein
MKTARTATDILQEFGLPSPPSGKDRHYTTCPQCSSGRSRAHQRDRNSSIDENRDDFGYARQPGLFQEGAAPADVLIGLRVELPDLCRCSSQLAVIEAGRGPHLAGLRCACGRHRGWVSGVSYKFLTEAVKRFGRLTEPIRIRALQARMTAPSGADAA